MKNRFRFQQGKKCQIKPLNIHIFQVFQTLLIWCQEIIKFFRKNCRKCLKKQLTVWLNYGILSVCLWQIAPIFR